MFTTLHFWAGFAAGGFTLIVFVVGGLFLTAKIIGADRPEDDDE